MVERDGTELHHQNVMLAVSCGHVYWFGPPLLYCLCCPLRNSHGFGDFSGIDAQEKHTEPRGARDALQESTL